MGLVTHSDGICIICTEIALVQNDNRTGIIALDWLHGSVKNFIPHTISGVSDVLQYIKFKNTKFILLSYTVFE